MTETTISARDAKRHLKHGKALYVFRDRRADANEYTPGVAVRRADRPEEQRNWTVYDADADDATPAGFLLRLVQFDQNGKTARVLCGIDPDTLVRI